MNRKEFLLQYLSVPNFTQLIDTVLREKYGAETSYIGDDFDKIEFIIEGDWDKKGSLSYVELTHMIDMHIDPLYTTLKPTITKVTKNASIF